MNSSYNQFRATMALARASFISILRSPSSVVFTLLFPLVFIVVFGFIGGGGVSLDVGIPKGSDTTNGVYQGMAASKLVRYHHDKNGEAMMKQLFQGKLDAVFNFSIQNQQNGPVIILNASYTKASPQNETILKAILAGVINTVNQSMHPNSASVILKQTTIEGRLYKTIDFILPGQLGFSLLSSGVFGTAFVFLSLRITLVIKRFFATPVRRYSIVLGEAISRMAFALLGALIIVLIGHYAFGFTLLHGFSTVVNMLILSALGLIVFMGFGFIISGIAKNEGSVPPLANIVTLPQFLLAGTFFSINAFPGWLQPISKALPLTYLNEGLRRIAFEGAGLADVANDIWVLLGWTAAVYVVAVRVFKWE